MIVYKCKNCPWEGETLSKTPLLGKCPICGDEVYDSNLSDKEIKKILCGEVPKGNKPIELSEEDKKIANTLADKAEEEKEPEKKLTGEAKKKLEDVKKDLKDDGKRNYSHDKKRNSPGRKAGK